MSYGRRSIMVGAELLGVSDMNKITILSKKTDVVPVADVVKTRSAETTDGRVFPSVGRWRN